MAGMIQLVMYEGYLAADPVMKYTATGTVVTNFRIGSSTTYKNSAGEKVKTTTWLRVTAWANLAEIVGTYLKKGSHVIVQGTLKGDENGSPKTFQLKNGDWAASFEIKADEVRMLGGGSDSGNSSEEVSGETEDFDF